MQLELGSPVKTVQSSLGGDTSKLCHEQPSPYLQLFGKMGHLANAKSVPQFWNQSGIKNHLSFGFAGQSIVKYSPLHAPLFSFPISTEATDQSLDCLGVMFWLHCGHIWQCEAPSLQTEPTLIGNQAMQKGLVA